LKKGVTGSLSTGLFRDVTFGAIDSCGTKEIFMGIIDKIPFLRNISGPPQHNGSYSTLEITTVFPCAVACRFCPQDKWKSAYKGNHSLTFDDFCKLLENIPREVRLDFSGFSEPFLNRDSSKMMLHAYQNGYQIALYTTLVGFTPHDAEIIKGINFASCTIHLPDDTNCRVPDEAKWLRTYELFAGNVNYDNANYHMGKLSPRIKKEVLRICRPPVLTRANNVDSDVVKPLDRLKGVIRCAISDNKFNQNVMMPNGDVYLCCMDWSLQHKLGNLFEHSYETLHDGEEYHRVCRSMQDPFLETICRYCERSRG
jgi:radical SAM protein with 4Fe4S-binding SPASM domain